MPVRKRAPRALCSTVAAAALVVVGLALAGCAGGEPKTSAAVAKPATMGRPTAAAATSPAPDTLWRVRLSVRSTLAEYTATTALAASACGSPHATWHGTLTFDSADIAKADRVREVSWTFGTDGSATVPVGPFHATLEGRRYTAIFTVYVRLTNGAATGSSAITVDDVRIHTQGYPDVSMRPFSTGYGTATPVTKTDESC